MSRPIRLGHIALSFHAASAAVVQQILEAHGHSVESRQSPHEEMFRRYLQPADARDARGHRQCGRRRRGYGDDPTLSKPGKPNVVPATA